MTLSPYERNVRREIETWQHGEVSLLKQAVNWAMKPVDWAVERVAPAELIDQAGGVLESVFTRLAEASEWTVDLSGILKGVQARGVTVDRLEDLRTADLEKLDVHARSLFTENAVLAAIEGGGTGLGGAALLLADIPLLFGINLRLIQQIAATYGFPLRGPDWRPLVLSVWNVAASGGRESRNEALREISVAAAAFARDVPFRGRVSGTFRDQNRHVPREIAKGLLSHKVLQAIPIAGAAVGAGVNYWFTTETAEAAYMLFRALYLEVKERG